MSGLKTESAVAFVKRELAATADSEKPAKTDPGVVARFVSEHRTELSGLSYREATKHIEELVR